MERSAFLLSALLLFFAPGCARHTMTDAEIQQLAALYEDVEEPLRTWAIERADAHAKMILDESNAEPEHNRYGEWFRLEDYSREVLRRRGETKISVGYQLLRPHSFLGHPSHFLVWVEEADGSTSDIRGR